MTASTSKVGLPRKTATGDLRRTVHLFRRFMGNPRVYLVGMLLLVLEAATAVVEPYPIAYLVDFLQGAKPALRELGLPTVLSSPRFETILLLTLAIVLIAALNSAADSLTEVCMARGGRSLGYSVRVAMYSHLQRLSLAYHDRKRTGDVLTRVTGDVLVLEDFVVKSVSNITGSLLVLLGSFAFLMYQSWNVAMVALVVIPMLATVSNHFSRRIKAASKLQRDREGDLASTAQEMLTSIRLVQSYGRGTVDLKQFSSHTERSMHAAVGAANIQAQFSFVIALVEALSIAAVIWLGVWLVDRNTITIGTLVLFVLLLQNMFKPARKIVSEWYKIGKVFASVERIQDLLDRDVVVRDMPDAVPAPALRGRLTFRHVGFSYPAEHEDGSVASSRVRVLEDIDFEVAPGEVVSLVGYSGAGKSTIAQLIPRLYDPDDGEVLVDGLPLCSFTLASLRSQISLVLQDTVLLSGTVAENIGYGIADATQADIEAAAKSANAHEFIMAMPEGYRTQLGERGSTLSGGQRQRLAIARAFIRRAPILILDEPTTGLDAESAHTVVGALRTLMNGKTTIVISHDPGLIQCADRILVISGGRIVESGPHETLLCAGGSYAGLHAHQSAYRGELGAGHAAPHRPSGHRHAQPSLVDGLAHRLPGMSMAMDEAFVSDWIGQQMLHKGTNVENVCVGKMWVRADGSCSLRYRLRLSGGGGTDGMAGEHLVLARVYSDPEAATGYLAHSLGRLPGVGSKSPVPLPWRSSNGLAPEAGTALHRFPLDPALPTLSRAMEPDLVSRLTTYSGLLVGPPTCEVVHYPREGACVLRYRFPGAPDSSTGGATFYGKVYSDASGDIVDGFLRALARTHEHALGPHGHTLGQDEPRLVARYPAPVVYAPATRLLVTEELPGNPVVPRLLKSVLTPHTGSNPYELAELREAVRACGHALAELHESDLTTAPVHTSQAELGGLQRELVVVGRVWPDVAEVVRQRTKALFGAALDSADMVLSHGDFTPAQVLLDGGSAAVVDLDTLCWADPALDLGRFLAQLELLAVKVAGEAALSLADDLASTFLSAYYQASARTPQLATLSDRISFYKGATLARSALRSCRQLKEGRFEIALSLLGSIDLTSGRVTR